MIWSSTTKNHLRGLSPGLGANIFMFSGTAANQSALCLSLAPSHS
jgi:hypothetical protein